MERSHGEEVIEGKCKKGKGQTIKICGTTKKVGVIFILRKRKLCVPYFLNTLSGSRAASIK